jgi:DNA-binding NtrC family response regulator
MKKNVLLVEHQENLRQLYESVLSGDFNVNVAKSNVEAFAWSKTGTLPDAIVATCSRNQSETTSLLQLLHASGVLSGIPIFLLDTHRSNAAHSFQTLQIRYITNPSTMVTQITQYLHDSTVNRSKKAADSPLTSDSVGMEPVAA